MYTHRMNKDIDAYNQSQNKENAAICRILAEEINNALPKAESKIWHGSPVWFLEGNPVTGYGVLKGCVRLLFGAVSLLTNRGSPSKALSRLLRLDIYRLTK